MIYRIEDWEIIATVDDDDHLTLSAKHGIDPATKKSDTIADSGADLGTETEFMIRLIADHRQRA